MNNLDTAIPKAFFNSAIEYEIAKYRYEYLNEPLAYVLGRIEFCGLEFKTDQRAYAPTIETQLMVRHVIGHIRSNNEYKHVIDIGTGCGVIGLSIASLFPELRVHCSDIIFQSIELARENGKRLNIDNVDYYIGDMLEAIPLNSNDRVLIVANLPYGSPRHLLPSIELDRYLKCPPSSLFTKGLIDSYKELIQQTVKRFTKFTVYCETGVLSKQQIEFEIPAPCSLRYFSCGSYSWIKLAI